MTHFCGFKGRDAVCSRLKRALLVFLKATTPAAPTKKITLYIFSNIHSSGKHQIILRCRFLQISGYVIGAYRLLIQS